MKAQRNVRWICQALVTVVVLGLVAPVAIADPDACQILYCPLGLDLCPDAAKKQIPVCRKVVSVENAMATTNKAVEGVENAYNGVNGELLKVQTEFARIQAGFEDVSDAALFFNQFNETLSALSDETLSVSHNLVSKIEEANRLTNFYLTFERERYMAFVGPNGCGYECQQFRQELMQLIDDCEETFNLAIVAMIAQLPDDLRSQVLAQPRIDLSAMKTLIENVPGVLLFPMHETFAALGTSDSFSMKLRQSGVTVSQGGSIIDVVSAQLEQIRTALLGIIETTAHWVNDGGTSLCVAIAQMDPRIHQAMTMYAAIVGVLTHIIYEVGDALEVSGLGDFDVKGAVDFAAFAGSAIRARPTRSAGKWLKALATLSLVVTDTITHRFDSCRIIIEQQVTLCVLANNKAKSFDGCRNDVYAGARFGF